MLLTNKEQEACEGFGIWYFFICFSSGFLKKLVDENLGEVDVMNSDVDFGESLINFQVLHPFSFLLPWT